MNFLKSKIILSNLNSNLAKTHLFNNKNLIKPRLIASLANRCIKNTNKKFDLFLFDNKNFRNNFRTCTIAFYSSRTMNDPTKSRGKQNTFYFDESNLLASLDKSDPAYQKMFKQIPVILVLGWAGASDNNLKKYQSIYAQMGYHTLRFAPSSHLTFVDTKNHRKYADELLDCLRNQYKLTENLIFTHFFSNACSFIMYQYFIDEMNKNNSDYDFFKQNHKGIIYDSAPGWVTKPISFSFGVSNLVKNQVSFAPVRYLISFFIRSGA